MLSFPDISFSISKAGFAGFWIESGFRFFNLKPITWIEANLTLFMKCIAEAVIRDGI